MNDRSSNWGSMPSVQIDSPNSRLAPVVYAAKPSTRDQFKSLIPEFTCLKPGSMMKLVSISAGLLRKDPQEGYELPVFIVSYDFSVD
jgi:hypothetical protein